MSYAIKLIFLFNILIINLLYAATDTDINKILKNIPPTVTTKTVLPPGVDKHDYVSYASYWWPNPDTADGLPYIRKDGVRNKELVNQGDAGKFHTMSKAVILLLREFNASQDQKYAKKAVEYINTWFLDVNTKMNPNVNHGQLIMGKNNGTKSGLIELRYMISLVEVLPILLNHQELIDNNIWSKEQSRDLINWFVDYYTWLISSKIAKQAATKFENNHGTWYDAQLTSIAIFLGRYDMAKQILENAKTRRIAKQIDSDGSQPWELKRTRSLTYSLFNLEALYTLAALGDKLSKIAPENKVNLWGYQAPNGASIVKAYEFIAPYRDDYTKWPKKQIDAVENWRWQVLDDKDNILSNIIQ